MHSPTTNELHFRVRAVYRETIKRQGNAAMAFECAVLLCAKRTPSVPEKDIRRAVAIVLATQPGDLPLVLSA